MGQAAANGSHWSPSGMQEEGLVLAPADAK
jgi:hypothetical protein